MCVCGVGVRACVCVGGWVGEVIIIVQAQYFI